MMPEALLKVLADGGIPVSAEELLDVLWLARHMPPGAAAPLARAAGRTDDAAHPGAVRGQSGEGDSRDPGHRHSRTPRPSNAANRPAQNTAADQAARASTRPRGPEGTGGALHAADGAGHQQTSPALPLRIPEGKVLTREELPLSRALRPLKRSRPDPRAWELDERATVTAVAETGLLDPVLRSARIRWLDLVMLVDDGVSMLLWRRLVTEVRQLLERSGAFRTVRVHGLDTRSQNAPRIFMRPYLGEDHGAAPTVSATDAAGGTLLLVMSDGVGTAWQDGRMHAFLARLARHGPTAVMHTLPEPLRDNSGIRGRLWQVTTRRAGAANHTWQIRDPVLPPELAPFDGLPVPVLEPSASVVEAWARLIGSAGTSERMRLLAPLPPALPPTTPWPDPQDAGHDVLRFRAAATPEAYRLAAHTAAVAPVTVPVMRLIQGVLGDHIDTSHLAEVFLGGMMRRTDTGGDRTHPEHRVFDFPEDTRRILLSTVPASELLRTSRALVTRLTELAGSAPEFAAWLAHEHGPGRVSATGRPFTIADERLLRRLGLSAAPASASPSLPPSGGGRADVRGLVDRPGSPWKSLREDDPARLGSYTLFARSSVVHGHVVQYLAWSSPRDTDPDRITLLRVPRSGDRTADRDLARTEATALVRLIGLSAPMLWRQELDDEPWLAVDPHLRLASRQPPQTLKALLRDGLLSETQLALTGAKLAAGVARAHGKQMVHGALTPDRVLVTEKEVLIADWATATIDGVPSRQRPAPELDSAYLAPELAARRPTQPTEASDVFALGALLLTMLPGFPAAEGELQRVLRQCVARDPRVRPSAAHLSRVLRAHAKALAPRFSGGRPGYPTGAEATAPRTLLISYAGVDRPWAEWIAWHLEEAGHHVVLDVPEVPPGAAFARHLHSAAQNADAVIMLLSKTYAASGWAGLDTDVLSTYRVIPLAVEAFTPEDLPESLRSVLRRNLFGLDEPAALAALLDAVRGPVPGPVPPFPSPLPPPAFRRPPVPTHLSVPDTWNVGRRNPDFTGRERVLAHLRDVFAPEERGAVQVLHGQVGVGKTEVAVEYAHRFARLYNAVWWIDAKDAERIPVQYAELGFHLGVRMTPGLIPHLLPELFERLRTRDDWLIVLDGVEDPETADRYIPDGPGHVLITSRNPAWAERARPTRLGVFTRLDAVEFLTERLGVTSREAYLRAEELGDHPLALARAVETHRTGVANDPYPPPVSQAVTSLGHEDLVAMDLLRMTAFLGPEPIPVTWAPELLQQYALPGLHLDPPPPETALRPLARRGLADVEDDTFRIHRLTQALVRARTDEEAVSGKVAAFLAAVDIGRPDVPDAWPLWSLFTAHLTTGHLGAAERPELRPRLLKAVDYLMASGQHQPAHDLIVFLRRTWSGAPGADHPDSLRLSNALAVTLNYLGRHQEAYGVHEDNVARSRRVRGDDHPDTLAAVHNLALSLHRLGRVPEAVPLLQDARLRAVRVGDPDHRVTERLTKTLAALLRLAGREHEAEELLHDRD
ncbi:MULTISPECIES: SAV_2336 N-terminal domain-related protein [unclassified Streptomyces]|uniref:SAV_2336 N-terminal domain-related protein n=1 Tax=unclassified Streptomyces TaxID=2593676 RepID=UPI0037F493E7